MGWCTSGVGSISLSCPRIDSPTACYRRNGHASQGPALFQLLLHQMFWLWIACACLFLSPTSAQKRGKASSKDMYNAAASGDVQGVLWALSKGGDPNWMHPEHKDNSMFVAARANHDEVIPYLMAAGYERQATLAETKETPLHVAAASGHVKAVQALVGHHFEANMQDADGHTPLHKAAMGVTVRHRDVVEILLRDAHADTAIRSKHGLTALDLAQDATRDALLQMPHSPSEGGIPSEEL